jgi:hypothetical protein
MKCITPGCENSVEGDEPFPCTDCEAADFAAEKRWDDEAERLEELRVSYMWDTEEDSCG